MNGRFLLLSLLIVACSPQDIAKAVEKNIVDELAASGVPGVTVKCPKIKKGEEVRCTATTQDGLEFPVVASASDDNASWKTPPEVGLGNKVAERIRDKSTKEYGVKYESVKCPPIVLADKNATCTATAEGQSIPYLITLKDGELHANPATGLVVTEKLHEILKGAVEKAQAGTVEKVDCGDAPKLQISTPGKKIFCTAHLKGGKSIAFEILVKDGDGNIDFKAVEEAAP
jgi:hypothetical protein